MPEQDRNSRVGIDLESDLSGISHERTAGLLRERFAAIRHSVTFKPGELVRWKPGLRNKIQPPDGRPAIVVEVLAEPIRDPSNDAGSSYFRERLDIVLGVLSETGEFSEYHYDSRRFEPCD